MEKKTQFSLGYFAFALLSVVVLRNAWVGVFVAIWIFVMRRFADKMSGMYQRTLELLRAREYLLRQSAAQLRERETLGESDLERIRAILASPVLPLSKAA